MLGRNRMEVEAASSFVAHGTREYKFDGYWSGEKWVKGLRGAKHFGSESDAITYLELNLALLEAPPARYVRS
jgi:hypothetical protein